MSSPGTPFHRVLAPALCLLWCAGCSLLVPGPEDYTYGDDATTPIGGAIDSGPGPVDGGLDASEGDSGPLDAGMADGGMLPPLDPPRRVAAGWVHTCMVRMSGEVYCWGDNAFGQIGDGSMTDRLTPTRVMGLPSDIIEVALAGYYTCALSASGSVWCWGNNADGQLGDETTTTPRLEPVRAASGIDDARRIAASGPTTCVIREDRCVYCWGDGANGLLGDGMLVDSLTPVMVQGVENAVGLAAPASTSAFEWMAGT